MIEFQTLVNYLDGFLRIGDISDASLNGLQVEGPREISRIAFAVDYSSRAVRQANEVGAGFLIVHHGLFWGKEQPIVGLLYRRLREMFEVGVGLYAVHLPLDVHPDVGNSICVCRALGLQKLEPFGYSHGVDIGLRGILPRTKPRDVFAADLRTLFGEGIIEFKFGPDEIGSVGVITGGGSSMVDQAAVAELDAFVTGEIKHGAYFIGEEGRVNLYACGHYATELIGIKALMAHINGKCDIETILIDIPTGL